MREESEGEELTCRNRFHIDHVGMESEDAVNLRRKSCPHNFGYAEEPDYCTGDRLEDHCFACWERQISEEFKEETKLIYAHTEYAGENNQSTSGPIIKDSGNRREFDSGAVRDMQEGKGRCDLMPLEVVANMYKRYDGETPPQYYILMNIKEFLITNETRCLYEVLNLFASNFKGYSTMFLEVAKHFEEGAKKYGENNWQKGIPVHCYIDSAVRHYLKMLRGDKDEPHDRAFVWNLMCCIWEVDYREGDSNADPVV